MQPHRGTLNLVLGILSIVLISLFGPAAVVLANTDLREMDEGRMDPAGRDLTRAGKVLGIVGCGIMALQILVVILVLLTRR